MTNVLFPQPVQPCRKVCNINAALAAGLLEIEWPHGLFSPLPNLDGLPFMKRLLFFIAVLISIPFRNRLRVTRESLLCRLADCDFVLRGCGWLCGLLILGWWSCRLRLGLRVDWMNR